MQAWLVAGGLRNPCLDPLRNSVEDDCVSVYHKAWCHPLQHLRSPVPMADPLAAMMIVVNLAPWVDRY